MNEKIKSPAVDELFQAVLSLENLDECYRFFTDVATIPEIKALAQRLQVAKLIDADETYAEISKKTSASTATISRVKNCILYGPDGYRLVLDRLKGEKS